MDSKEILDPEPRAPAPETLDLGMPAPGIVVPSGAESPTSSVLRRGLFGVGSAMALAGLLVPAPSVVARDESSMPDPIPVEGFEQLLPRGKIAALVDPDFVPAAEAEIPDGAWVLGFVSGGQAYAYDLNTLNSHEVVNHGDEEGRFAAVW